MATNSKQLKPLDIPFKEFMPGQVIQSVQFNDDMRDIEDTVNELVNEHNIVSTELSEHVDNLDNPHQVDAHQTGTYNSTEIDEFFQDIKGGNLDDNAITNRVLDDECVDTRNYMDNSITASKLDISVGNQIDISQNISIADKYTKDETDELIRSKVGEGTYSREELDVKFEQVQAGQILDKSISIHQLKDDVGRRLDISNNPDILNKYTRDEVDLLIQNNALPRDWGSILEEDNNTTVIPTKETTLPVANHMKVNTCTVSESSILDVDIQENVDARIGANGVTYNNVGSAIRAVGSGTAITNFSISQDKVKYATDFIVDCNGTDMVLNFNTATKEVEVNLNNDNCIAYGINTYWSHYANGYGGVTGLSNIPFPTNGAGTYMLVGRNCLNGRESTLQFIHYSELKGGDFVFATVYFGSSSNIIKISTTCKNPLTITVDGSSITIINDDDDNSLTSAYSSKYINNNLGGAMYAIGSYISFDFDTKNKVINIKHSSQDIIFYGRGYKKCTNSDVTSIDISSLGASTYCLVMRKDGTIQFISKNSVLASDIIICIAYWNGTSVQELYTAINNCQDRIKINGVPSYNKLYKYDIQHQFSNRHVWGIGNNAKINFNTTTKQVEFSYSSSVTYINLFTDVGYNTIQVSKLDPIPFPTSEWTYVLVARVDRYDSIPISSIEFVKMDEIKYTDIIIATVCFSSSGDVYDRISGIKHIEQITLDNKPFNVDSYGIVNDDKTTNYTSYSANKINTLINTATNKTYRFALGLTFTINFNTIDQRVEFKNVPKQAIIFDNVAYWMKSASSNNTIDSIDFPSTTGTYVLVATVGTKTLSFKQESDITRNDITLCTIYFVNKKINKLSTSIGDFNRITKDDEPFVVHPAIDDSKSSSRLTYSSSKIDLLTGNETANYAIPSDIYLVDELPLYKDSILDIINNRVSMYLAQGDEVTPFDKMATVTNSTSSVRLGIIQNNTDTQKTITVHSVQSTANNGKSIKYQALGDSLTNRGVANHTKTKLSNYGVTTICIGTMTNSSVKGEGREGWTYANFVGRSNKFLNDGSAITPLTSKGNGSLKTNPFIRLATDDDKTNHPDWCFRNTGSVWELSYSEDSDKTGDFYIFDYANYLSVQGLDSPDIITIGLSTNDISVYTSGDKYIVSCTEGLNIMIKQIKTALPNVKIGIIPTPVCRVHADNVIRRKKDILWANSCMSQIDDLKSTYTNLYIVPVWIHMSRYGIYQDSDKIHWGSVGYYQYKNVVASWIMNII